MIADYTEDFCDLCGDSGTAVLMEGISSRSMTSDSRVVDHRLLKRECSRCGLARDGNARTAMALANMYREDYSLNVYQSEYCFFTDDGPVPRSQVFFQWIRRVLGEANHQPLKKILEVGCGSGDLMKRISEAFPHATCIGVEMSERASSEGGKRGLRIIQGDFNAAPEEKFDFIYAVGVLEHVPSPSKLLTAIRDRLAPSGVLILSQPVQDVIGYDIFFADHLHHFASGHLSMYAKKLGFFEEIKVIGHPMMPNFSLHLWKKSFPERDLNVLKIKTKCRESVRIYIDFFHRVNRLVEEVQADSKRKLSVFGLNEVFALLMANTKLWKAEIACGLSDIETHGPIDFPVVKPERVLEFSVTDVLMCVNRVYEKQVRQRLTPMGVKVHAF